MGLLEKFKNTKAYMDSYSKELIKLLRIEIGRNRSRTYKTGTYNKQIDYTGNLRRSLEAIVKQKPKSINLDIKGLGYGQRIDQGLAQSKQPPLGEIVEWIKKKPISLRDSKGRFVTATDAKIRGIAFAIAKSKLQPKQPVNFIDEAINQSMDKLNNIGGAIAKDVEPNIEDILLKAGYIKKGENYIIEKDGTN